MTKKRSSWNVRKITFVGVLTAMALALSVIESFIPSGVPGAKLGLANLVILVSLSYFGFFTTLAIDVVRILLASLITGTFLSMGFYMSLAGGLCSFLVMYVFHRWLKVFTSVGVSLMGAYVHSLAQVFVAVIFLESWSVFYYFPLLAAISLLTGLLNGMLAEAILNNSYLKRKAEEMKRG